MDGDIIAKMSLQFSAHGDQLSADILKFALSRVENDAGGLVKNFISSIENEKSGIYKNIVKQANGGLVLYGAGNVGSAFLSSLLCKGIEVAAVIDTHKTGILQGKPIITLEEYKTKYPALPVVITPLLFRQEIAHILCENGVSFVDIDPLEIADITPTPESISLRQRSEGEPYISLVEMPWQDDEVFVDCGMYDGENTLDFVKKCQEQGCTYRKIFGFEADPQNFVVSSKNLSKIPGVTLFNKGVSDYCGDAKIIIAGQGSTVTQYGGESITLVTLDEALQGERVTFIKMDIEGGELAALRGGAEIIRSQKPKLAISVYHKFEDIWEIPAFIWSLNPDYQFYLRQYTDTWIDTVLYAIP